MKVIPILNINRVISPQKKERRSSRGVYTNEFDYFNNLVNAEMDEKEARKMIEAPIVQHLDANYKPKMSSCDDMPFLKNKSRDNFLDQNKDIQEPKKYKYKRNYRINVMEHEQPSDNENEYEEELNDRMNGVLHTEVPVSQRKRSSPKNFDLPYYTEKGRCSARSFFNEPRQSVNSKTNYNYINKQILQGKSPNNSLLASNQSLYKLPKDNRTTPSKKSIVIFSKRSLRSPKHVVNYMIDIENHSNYSFIINPIFGILFEIKNILIEEENYLTNVHQSMYLMEASSNASNDAKDSSGVVSSEKAYTQSLLEVVRSFITSSIPKNVEIKLSLSNVVLAFLEEKNCNIEIKNLISKTLEMKTVIKTSLFLMKKILKELLAQTLITDLKTEKNKHFIETSLNKEFTYFIKFNKDVVEFLTKSYHSFYENKNFHIAVNLYKIFTIVRTQLVNEEINLLSVKLEDLGQTKINEYDNQYNMKNMILKLKSFLRMDSSTHSNNVISEIIRRNTTAKEKQDKIHRELFAGKEKEEVEMQNLNAEVEFAHEGIEEPNYSKMIIAKRKSFSTMKNKAKVGRKNTKQKNMSSNNLSKLKAGAEQSDLFNTKDLELDKIHKGSKDSSALKNKENSLNGNGKDNKENQGQSHTHSTAEVMNSHEDQEHKDYKDMIHFNNDELELLEIHYMLVFFEKIIKQIKVVFEEEKIDILFQINPSQLNFSNYDISKIFSDTSETTRLNKLTVLIAESEFIKDEINYIHRKTSKYNFFYFFVRLDYLKFSMGIYILSLVLNLMMLIFENGDEENDTKVETTARVIAALTMMLSVIIVMVIMAFKIPIKYTIEMKKLEVEKASIVSDIQEINIW
eukprot:CAMPEP_0170539530 /NCGR_PEP_ID=MMETSP0209-20121228/103993_1 /TAXON_ID=665100 ORGANISM="Litonotus pictus, Strain P1" /NCGR_SAMPLE_ID=MMETSP0209 /ASSEMBLY_ACC=CAM_ASM_000301 /LENGTH=852 /DNA_ID=CAMNT_0010841495 /DNA_START=621 /DNA_END=3176 /DNA_ORIENTATION=-